jgi:hypothetical protein
MQAQLDSCPHGKPGNLPCADFGPGMPDRICLQEQEALHGSERMMRSQRRQARDGCGVVYLGVSDNLMWTR